MFKNIRTFSSFGRSLFRPRSALRQHDGLVHIQRVRIVRPLFTFKRAQTASLYIVGIAIYWHFVGPDDDAEDEDEQKQQQKQSQEQEQGREQKQKSQPGRETATQKVAATENDGEDEYEGDGYDDEEDEDEEEENPEATNTGSVDEVLVPDTPPEDAWFIPLGWAHQCPPKFYKGSDPEWQSFIAFARDRQRSLLIRNELAGLVGGHLAGMRGFQKFLGAPISPGKYWLDIDFPDGPPPEYERGGIEITDDYVAWTNRPVHPMNITRLQSALLPTSMMSSMWASYSALWSLQVAKVKNFLNIKPRSEGQGPKVPPGLIDFQRLAKTRDGQQRHPGPGVDESPNGKPSDSAEAKTESDAAKVLPLLPTLPQPTGEMGSALSAFKRTLAKTWKPAIEPAPRGTFMVSGLVEVLGPKGVCVLDVRAAYHPAESRWVTIGMGVRRIQPRKQRPKGGN